MSHQPTTTDFDKLTVKRTSNESHDEESKKLKLEKSGSVLTNPAGAGNISVQQATHLLTSNKGIAASASEMNSKKIKSGMKLNETTTTASSSTIVVEDGATTTIYISDNQGGNKVFMLNTDKKSEQMILSASNAEINPENPFTYRLQEKPVVRKKNPLQVQALQANKSTLLQRTSGVVTINLTKSDRHNLQHQTLQVPVLPSPQKLIPDVTQTTAKVSIDNTTISRPSLKPLSSTQILKAGSSNTGQGGSADGTKSVIHAIQTSGNPSSETQFSKIFNIKQLQIKPVVSKKIPLQIQAVQANKSTPLQRTSGVVTIASTKSDPHNLQQQQTVPLRFVKEIATAAIIKTSTVNIEDTSSSTNTSNNGAGEMGSTKLSSDSTVKILDKSPQLLKPNTSGDTTSNVREDKF